MRYPLPYMLVIGTVITFTGLMVGFKIHSAFASCIQDEDWPEKPCLDTPPYTQEFLKQVWQKYYEFKGKDWMDMKKLEMDRAVTNGTLREWVESSNANRNVWEYYYNNGQAPDAYGWSTLEIRYENKTYPVQHLTFGGDIKSITASNLGIMITLQSEQDGLLRVAIPKELLNETRISYDANGNAGGIFVDQKLANYTSASTEKDILFTIPFEAGSEEVEIAGTDIPEFGSYILASAGVSAILALVIISGRYRIGRH